MLFNSFAFLIFFPIVTALYFLLPHRFRWMMLLVASCIFYMMFIPVYILILAITILIDYFAAIGIERTSGARRRMLLTVSIIATCAVLFVFKYFNFFNTNMTHLARMLDWNYPIASLQIILPIGLSFHTFQSLSYVIEVYRGKQKAEYHFGIYALYVMFYPQLVAGPIERPQNLLHQFYEKHHFSYRRVTDGLKLMAWGLFKKIVIADRLAVMVNTVYGRPGDFAGVDLCMATVFFAFQIYCDFSGYSDVAIGAAQVMGFKLMDNFNRPYYSKSIAEFWKRWHISLSTWFKDYLYISMGGNRVSVARWQLNLFITFVISGLWHGANWTYVIWGALNGMYLIVGNLTANVRRRAAEAVGLTRVPALHKTLKVLTTFALICFAWIFFRANSLSDAFIIVSRLLTPADPATTSPGFYGALWMGHAKKDVLFAVLMIALMEAFHWFQRHGSIRHMLSERPIWARWGLYYGIVFAILCFGAFGSAAQFIYFQF